MQNKNILLIFIVAYSTSGLFLISGGIIKYFNAGNVINFYDPKKHDRDKTSFIIGRNFMCIGTCTMVIPFISIFVDNSYFKLMMSMIAVITLTGLIITYYQFSKYCGKDKAEGQ